MNFLNYLLIFVCFFIISYIIYYWFSVRPVVNNYKKKKKGKSIKKERDIPTEVKLLQSYYKIDIEKIGVVRTLRIVNFVNAFFLSLLVMTVLPFKEIWLKLLILFVLIIPAIWVVYYFLAKYLKYLERKSGK